MNSAFFLITVLGGLGILLNVGGSPLSSVTGELAAFVKDNTNRGANIICRQRLPVCSVLYEHFVKESLLTSRMATKKKRLELSYQQDFAIVVLEDPGSDAFHESLRLVVDSKRQTSLIYFTRSLSTADWSSLEESFSTLQRDSHFYLASGGKFPLDFFLLITLNHQSDVAINQLEFIEGTRLIKESYDLYGMPVTSISLTWAPHIVFDDCNELMRECKTSYGSLRDQIRLFEASFNFTLVSVQGDGDWGVAPIEGPFNLSGTWGGVMGGVINGDYHFSLCLWTYKYERNSLMDFVQTSLSDYLLLALTPQPAKVDTALFTRPFTENSWQAITGMTCFIAVIILSPRFILTHFEETTSFQIASTTSWYFFVLLNTFYGGALTMFFTNEVSIPFEDIKDVMRAYDEWNLIMMAGNSQT